MIKISLKYSIVIASIFVLTAGEGLKKQIGFSKTAPDEFTVVTKAPLILPPDFNLRPPQLGAPGPKDIEAQELARRALIRSGREVDISESPKRRHTGSRSEALLLQKAGADKADPKIRSVIRSETLAVTERDSAFINKLMFWGKGAEESLVDAKGEAKRLRDAAAKGIPPTTGETPVIDRTGESFLKRIF